MPDDVTGSSEPSKEAPKTNAPAPTTHFFPYATSPDIIRSHEKDAFITANLTNQAQTVIRALKGARYAHGHAITIKNLTELLYFSLTTLIGNRTLGEEYCDVVQLENGTLQLPSLARRVGYIFSAVLVPWLFNHSLPSLRRKLRARLERSIARQQVQAATQGISINAEKTSKKNKTSLWNSLRLKEYILEHLDSLTSPSPIYALSLATFYFTGAYYHLSKRIWGLRYVFTKRIDENEQRVGYEVLGVLLVLQMTIQGIIHLRKTIQSFQEERGSDNTQSTVGEQQKGEISFSSIQNPPSIPSLSPGTARYDLSENPSAVPWIPEGQNQKCTLCLELFKDPSVTTCGHVFCWTCVRDWVREKPECPLCRQEVLASKILPVRG